MAILCSVCSTTAEPAAQIGAIAVCGHCGASLHVDDAGQVISARRATGAETTALSAVDLQTLRKARGRTR